MCLLASGRSREPERGWRAARRAGKSGLCLAGWLAGGATTQTSKANSKLRWLTSSTHAEARRDKSAQARKQARRMWTSSGGNRLRNRIKRSLRNGGSSPSSSLSSSPAGTAAGGTAAPTTERNKRGRSRYGGVSRTEWMRKFAFNAGADGEASQLLKRRFPRRDAKSGGQENQEPNMTSSLVVRATAPAAAPKQFTPAKPRDEPSASKIAAEPAFPVSLVGDRPTREQIATSTITAQIGARASLPPLRMSKPQFRPQSPGMNPEYRSGELGSSEAFAAMEIDDDGNRTDGDNAANCAKSVDDLFDDQVDDGMATAGRVCHTTFFLDENSDEEADSGGEDILFIDNNQVVQVGEGPSSTPTGNSEPRSQSTPGPNAKEKLQSLTQVLRSSKEPGDFIEVMGMVDACCANSSLEASLPALYALVASAGISWDARTLEYAREQVRRHFPSNARLNA
ncbi:unnamed protein product, partial [Durusdinium trenchii]